MRRSKGTHKLETITIEGVGSADVYIELNSGSFYSYLSRNGDRIADKSLEGIRTKVRAALSSRGHLNWIPVIQINTGQGVDLDYQRFFIAKRGDGIWLWVGWDEEPDMRLDRGRRFHLWNDLDHVSNIKIPMHIKDEKDERQVHLLPFTEELWTGLEDLSARVEVLGRRLDALLNSDAGRRRLESKQITHLLPK